MKRLALLLCCCCLLPAAMSRAGDCDLRVPTPVLKFLRVRQEASGTRYFVGVSNFSRFPDALFAPSPRLPPCGANRSASRTWVTVFDNADRSRSGFCAFNAAANLAEFWIFVRTGEARPDCVYATLTDRLCDREYRSNCVSLDPCTLPQPEPELTLLRAEVEASGTRYYIGVSNSSEFSDELFAPSPELPPCGRNTSASRTWVDVYDDAGRRNGFCSFNSAANMEEFWTFVRNGEAVPDCVYVTLNDRLCQKEYRSNCVSLLSCPEGLPNPEVAVLRSETEAAGTRYFLGISNSAAYPDEMFAPAPTLPPCGLNANASRTWVDIFDGGGERLFGYCAFNQAEDLDELWFFVPTGGEVLDCVYVTLDDRLCDVVYPSNCVSLESQTLTCDTPLPEPELEFIRSEEEEVGTRYFVGISNASDYPDALFAPSADLPPCGLNTNASRTWVGLFDSDDVRLNGYCAFGRSSSLDEFWFFVPRGDIAPRGVYVTLTDRRCARTLVSNQLYLSPRGRNIRTQIRADDGTRIGVSFAEVEKSGTTKATREAGCDVVLPRGLRSCGTPVCFDITSAALSSGAIEICIDYSDLDMACAIDDGASLVLLWDEDHDPSTPPHNVTLNVDADAKLICGVVEHLTLFTLAVVGDEEGGALPGDCNQDARLDISDVVCLGSYLFQGSPNELPCDEGEVEPAPADVSLEDWNNDARLDVSDVIGAAAFLFQGGPAHPLAGPNPATDCVPISGCPPACPVE